MISHIQLWRETVTKDVFDPHSSNDGRRESQSTDRRVCSRDRCWAGNVSLEPDGEHKHGCESVIADTEETTTTFLKTSQLEEFKKK